MYHFLINDCIMGMHKVLELIGMHSSSMNDISNTLSIHTDLDNSLNNIGLKAVLYPVVHNSLVAEHILNSMTLRFGIASAPEGIPSAILF